MLRGIIRICVPPINILHAILYEHITQLGSRSLVRNKQFIINTLNLRDGDFNGLAKTHA